MWRYVFLVCLLVSLLCPPIADTGAAPTTGTVRAAVYIITDLSAGLNGPLDARATRINDAGQVVGSIMNNYAERGFFYQDGQFRDIPYLSALNAINAHGEATGYELNGRSYTRAALYQNGQASTIPGIAESSLGNSINDDGVIVGQNGSSGFIFDGTVLRDVPLLPGMTTALPFGINNHGQIVGNTGNFSQNPGRFYPFLADSTGAHALLPLPAGYSGTASAINNAGTIIVNVDVDSSSHAYLYQDGRYIDLDPGVSVWSRSLALNEADQVVGLRDGRAFIYSDGTLCDLNTLIAPDSDWRLVQANDINNHGQIVGYGEFQGATRPFLLTPRFLDIAPSTLYGDVLLQLTDRDIVQGYGDGRVGPADLVVRAQAAALIARSVEWDAENWTDKNFSDQGAVDNDLWRNVRALAHHGVAQGYDDGTYNPTGLVLHHQVALFVARAMIEKGYWVRAQDTNPYPNLPNTTAREQADRRDIATYVEFAGAIPDRPIGQPWTDRDQPATRGWFAQVLWQALQSTTTATTTP